MKIIFVDLKGQLHLRMKVEYEACPAAAHHIRGKVGRQIPQSKGSPKKYFENKRFSFLRCVISKQKFQTLSTAFLWLWAASLEICTTSTWT